MQYSLADSQSSLTNLPTAHLLFPPYSPVPLLSSTHSVSRNICSVKHLQTKAYLHRFKIIDSPRCPCETGNQTVDRPIYECQRLQKEREALTRSTTKQDTWPSEKSDLVNKYTKRFTQFINSIDSDKM